MCATYHLSLHYVFVLFRQLLRRPNVRVMLLLLPRLVHDVDLRLKLPLMMFDLYPPHHK